MSILVTGGAGFIGSHTCVELLNAGYDVVVVDNLYNASPKALERVKEITGKDLKFYTDAHGQNNGLRQVWGTPTYTYTWGGDQYWSLPIPIREIQMNPNMQQTPGWE